MLSCSVVSDSLLPHGLWPTRLLSPWDSPGKNTGVGGHVCLPDPGIEPVSPALAGGFFTTEPPGKPPSCIRTIFKKQKRRDLLGGPVVKSPVQGDTGTIAVWAS